MNPEEIAKIKREAKERAEFIESIYHLGRVSGDVAKAHKDQRTILALCAEVERLQARTPRERLLLDAFRKTPCTGNGRVHVESCFKCATLNRLGYFTETNDD